MKLWRIRGTGHRHTPSNRLVCALINMQTVQESPNKDDENHHIDEQTRNLHYQHYDKGQEQEDEFDRLAEYNLDEILAAGSAGPEP